MMSVSNFFGNAFKFLSKFRVRVLLGIFVVLLLPDQVYSQVFLSAWKKRNSCNVAPWGTIADRGSVTAYTESNPLPTSSCASISEVRICNDGSLSGTRTFSSCQNGCSGTLWGNVRSGYSGTAYYDSYPVGYCTSQARTCTNGTMSGSYSYTSCVDGCASPFVLGMLCGVQEYCPTGTVKAGVMVASTLQTVYGRYNITGWAGQTRGVPQSSVVLDDASLTLTFWDSNLGVQCSATGSGAWSLTGTGGGCTVKKTVASSDPRCGP